MKKFAESFYKSERWQKCRNAYFKYKNGICERCGEAGKIVHHKVHLTAENIYNPRISLSFKNLELLCQKCHNAEHSDDMKFGRRKKAKEKKAKEKKPNENNQPRYQIDENGNILPPDVRKVTPAERPAGKS